MGRSELREAPGLREACAIFFGERAEAEATLPPHDLSPHPRSLP
jgi:hypothetical protein